MPLNLPGLIFSPEDAVLLERKWRMTRTGYALGMVPGQRNKSELVHHVVCIRAFGRKPDRWGKGEVTDHINRNKLDNRRENLRIVQESVNARNRSLKNVGRGDAHWKAKLSYERVREIKAIHAEGKTTYAALGIRFGVSNTTIFRAVKGKLWNKYKND